MVQLIIGEKGKGKTKELLDKVNKEIQDITGNVVYLDKNTRHMFELNNIPVSKHHTVTPVIDILHDGRDLRMLLLDLFPVLFHRIMICRRCILTVS